MTAWIFQSSPKSYDLPGLLREQSLITWLANQYRSEIKPTDRVYLWETGDQSGVLAVATVLSNPAMMAQSADEAKFNRGGHDLSGDKWRVRLRVDNVLSPRLLKTDLITKNQNLAGLPNIRFAHATNFKLSPEEATALAGAVEVANGDEAEDEQVQPPPLTQEGFRRLRASSRDCDALAACGISTLLALEIAEPGRSAEDRRRFTGIDPADGH